MNAPFGHGYGSTSQPIGSTRPCHTTPTVMLSQAPHRTVSIARCGTGSSTTATAARISFGVNSADESQGSVRPRATRRYR